MLTSPQQASPTIFRLSETTDQANYPMGAWLVGNTRYRKALVMAADFAGGRHSVEAFLAGFRAAGGDIATEIYPPFGADAIRFVEQYRESGLELPLTGHSALTADTILPKIGEAALGIVSVGSYSAAVETSENRQFVREYEAAYSMAI